MPPALLTASKLTHESINPTFFFNFCFVSTFPSHLPTYSLLLSRLVFLYPHKSVNAQAAFPGACLVLPSCPVESPTPGDRHPQDACDAAVSGTFWALTGPEVPAKYRDRRDLESHTSSLEHGGQSLEENVGPF
ncbi:unnamed protein product [Rangifer tarandus platyrhynchus]|uniref:Uncharacterized protein n=2 Tax=Rangifer tarandus platyrhynchus TaxID=3082113 RepID=A0AC60A9N2_RANTA|nr:unnamed protein product [Rangifer tarandus platyrhynchus]